MREGFGKSLLRSRVMPSYGRQWMNCICVMQQRVRLSADCVFPRVVKAVVWGQKYWLMRETLR
jgi:hypothetical protein